MRDLRTPAAYRHALDAQELLLRATIARRLRARDADVPLGGVTNRVRHPTLGHVAAERLLPGVDAPAVELQHHVTRYVWAFRACEDAVVTDIGCGVGYGTSLLSWVARTAVGTDRDEAAIDEAKRRYQADNLRFECTDPDRSPPVADVVTCFEVLEHVDDPAALCQTLLTTAPRALLSYPNPFAAGPHLNPHHRVDWPLRVLKLALARAGARGLRGHHQRLGSPAVRPGTPPWAAVWLLDARR